MRTAWLWLGMVLVLACPLSADAQRPEGEPYRGLNGAVEKLFEHRERLSMTTQQLARVQEIKDSADARKHPYWQQIMTVRRELKARQKGQPEMPEAEKSAMLENSARQIESLLAEIRSIDHSAMRDVSTVLTPEQKEIIREMVATGHGGGGRPEDSRERGDRRH
jgi:phosphoenolpyruvate carboxylase